MRKNPFHITFLSHDIELSDLSAMYLANMTVSYFTALKLSLAHGNVYYVET